MKKYLIMIIAAAVLTAAFPKLFGMITDGMFPVKAEESITLTLTESGEQMTLTAEEYLIGCLFAQIDITYELEALKAQAAAAYTYALRLIEDGAELSDSTSACQPFFTPEKAKEYYGDSYETYLAKVTEAADYGAAHVIYYENKPIYSVYHSVSSGVTARPEYIWGISLPYLKQVSCPDDLNYSGYQTENEISAEDMRLKLLEYDGSLQMPLDYSMWFSDINRDENGYVLTASVGGKTLTGGDLWRILGLRSTAFDISWNGMAFSVTAYGYGHGAGMSQYTANCMAKEGESAKEILEYFYEGAEVMAIGG